MSGMDIGQSLALAMHVLGFSCAALFRNHVQRFIT